MSYEYSRYDNTTYNDFHANNSYVDSYTWDKHSWNFYNEHIAKYLAEYFGKTSMILSGKPDKIHLPITITEDSQKEEWDYMWTMLALHPVNKGTYRPKVCETLNGYKWKYIETKFLVYASGDKIIVHNFRHDRHPVTHHSENLNLRVSFQFEELCERS